MHEHVILVVDDDDDLRDSVRDVLADEGYTVATAANGAEALERLGTMAEEPCLVLLDLMMPLMDGYEFLDEIARTEQRRVPVVVMTAHATAKTPTARKLLRKPVALDTLLATVREVCARQA